MRLKVFPPNHKPWGVKGANEVSTHCQLILFRLLLSLANSYASAKFTTVGANPRTTASKHTCPNSGQPCGAHPTAGGGEWGWVEAAITAVTNTFAPANTHMRVCKKLFRNFHLFKRAGQKSIKCWPGLRAGLAEAAWVAELYEKQMESSLEPGQAIVFTTKSTSQLEAIHVPTTLHRAFPHPTCRMTVPSGCWAREQKGAPTQPENLWFRFTLHPSGIPHRDSCCGLSRQGSFLLLLLVLDILPSGKQKFICRHLHPYCFRVFILPGPGILLELVKKKKKWTQHNGSLLR